MRILHVVPTYLPAWRHGGPILAVHGLCKALAARGHEVTVLTTNVHGDGTLDVPLERPVAMDGITVRYFPVRPPRRLYFAPGLGRVAREEMPRYDAVHLHSVFLWPTTAAARAAERAGVPYVLSPRGMLVPDLMRTRGRWRKLAWMLAAERRTINRAAVLHATSELEAEEAARLDLPLPPVAVVPNGIDPEPWDDDLGALSPAVRSVLEGGPFFLFLGRISWKKGLDRLIPAMKAVPGAVLAVAGNDEERLRPSLENLAQDGSVIFLGPVHGPDKAALLHRAAALVLPSRSENFGNVVLEAWAAGRPVVVTPEVGLAETVRETGAGVVVAAADLGEALREMLADPDRREEMGRRGAEAVRECFGWGEVARRMEGVYERVVR
jgi:glycosyltransferase involved in cell wall biosynthesis